MPLTSPKPMPKPLASHPSMGHRKIMFRTALHKSTPTHAQLAKYTTTNLITCASINQHKNSGHTLAHFSLPSICGEGWSPISVISCLSNYVNGLLLFGCTYCNIWIFVSILLHYSGNPVAYQWEYESAYAIWCRIRSCGVEGSIGAMIVPHCSD